VKFKNILFVALGFLFLGLGIIGIVLPLVPTTPLLLLASYFFVKGSRKFELWFKGTFIYKQHLEEFIKERSLTRRKKIIINVFADLMIIFAFLFAESIMVRVILVLIMLYKYYYFIFKIKTVKN
jgi:uncharacterized membrane protein YbaN (DUF454 family)